MDGTRFDTFARFLSTAGSRRESLKAVAAAGLVLGLGWLGSASADAKKKHQTKKPKFIAFGCLNVGAMCRGKDSLCCSGICGGKKPKKGERDKRRCLAHDTGGCQANEGNCGQASVACTTSAGGPGECRTTTGNAGYCMTDSFGGCETCSKDADCDAVVGGPKSACIVCSACDEGTACVSFDKTL